MTKLSELYKKQQSEKLLEARVNLLEKGVYPFETFLKEHSETISTAEKIEQLEEVAELYKDKVPTLHVLVKENTNLLMESSVSTKAVEAAMVNYAFICESLNKCVNEAAKIFSANKDNTKTLQELYRNDATTLLEFCIKRSEAHKLLEGDVSLIVSQMSKELSTLKISELKTLCESVPSMRLYVSRKVHDMLAESILQG